MVSDPKTPLLQHSTSPFSCASNEDQPSRCFGKAGEGEDEHDAGPAARVYEMDSNAEKGPASEGLSGSQNLSHGLEQAFRTVGLGYVFRILQLRWRFCFRAAIALSAINHFEAGPGFLKLIGQFGSRDAARQSDVGQH